MSGRRGLLDIGDGHRDGGSASGIGHPDRAHRNCSRHLEIHSVSYEYPSVLVSLGITALHSVFLHDFVDTVIVLGEEFTDGLTPIEEELFGLLA